LAFCPLALQRLVLLYPATHQLLLLLLMLLQWSWAICKCVGCACVCVAAAGQLLLQHRRRSLHCGLQLLLCL
jgi:hypothetical protein